MGIFPQLMFELLPTLGAATLGFLQGSILSHYECKNILCTHQLLERLYPEEEEEYYLPYQEQHVGHQEGHFYRNQESYSRYLGEVPYDEEVKGEEEEAQYSVDENK